MLRTIFNSYILVLELKMVLIKNKQGSFTLQYNLTELFVFLTFQIHVTQYSEEFNLLHIYHYASSNITMHLVISLRI